MKEYSALEGASLIFVLRILTVTSAFPWKGSWFGFSLSLGVACG